MSNLYVASQHSSHQMMLERGLAGGVVAEGLNRASRVWKERRHMVLCQVAVPGSGLRMSYALAKDASILFIIVRCGFRQHMKGVYDIVAVFQ